MNTLRQAAEQALEALESDPDAMVEVSECHWHYKRDLAITVLRAALAEPEQEPVAWRLYKGGELYAIKYEKEDRGSHYTWEPLYTAPTPRKPLTDEELEPLCDAVPCYDIGNSDLIDFARAIERAHGITGETK